MMAAWLAAETPAQGVAGNPPPQQSEKKRKGRYTQMSEMMKSLKQRAMEFDQQLPLMEGREKGNTDELLGQVCTLDDYGFLPNENGEQYVAFTVKERLGKFYFGGSVLTARMTELDGEGYGESIRAEGLPLLMTTVTSKANKRKYTNVKFYPEG